MKPEFFCCIGAELKDEIAGSLKSSRIFMYRAAESQTIADMLVDGFFNEADDLRLNDLILLYCPEQSRAITYAKVSSVSGGVVKTSSVNISPEDIHIDTTGYSNISGSNLQQIINSIDSQFNKYLKLDGSSTMTGVLKMRASVSFECAIAPYWHGVGFYKLNDDDSVSLMASMEATDGFEPGTNNTYNIGSTSKKWKNLYLAGKAYVATINNGADISVPTTSGTMALTSDIAIKSSEAEITSPIQNQVLKYNGSKWVNATVQDLDNVITNCVTEIPQDIKLEVSSTGSLILKAGSKVYIPNGPGVFTPVIMTVDHALMEPGTDMITMLVVDANGNFNWRHLVSECFSGPTAPTAYTNMLWYDTTNNVIKMTNNGGTTWSTTNYSFPVCIATRNVTTCIIDQVFNGFGYIGSHVFALPGLKVLIPNGKNADGTLKNLTGAVSVVRVQDVSPVISNNRIIEIFNTGLIGRCQTLETNNDNYNIVDGHAVSYSTGICKVYTDSNGKITNFNTKQPFRAVDYNDYQKTVEQVNTNTTTKQDVATAVNYNNITNCITEIPQDIKLTLSSGTLTLKAGSKCYLKTDTTTPSVIVASDLTTTQTTDGTYFAIYNGSALTTVLTTAYNYNTLPSTYSLPLGLVTVSGGAISSIDQIFNGFGFIGLTVFALPGVKIIAPDGRNNNGTLKNIVFNVDSIKTQIYADSNNARVCFLMGLYFNLIRESEEKIWYDADKNMVLGQRLLSPYTRYQYRSTILGYFDVVSGQITSLHITKQPFHAVDMSEADYVVESQLPNAGNNYIWYRKYKSGYVEQGCLRVQDSVAFTFPVAMNDTDYSVIATTMVGTGEVRASSVRQDLKTTTDCVVYFGGSTYYGYVEVKGKAA